MRSGGVAAAAGAAVAAAAGLPPPLPSPSPSLEALPKVRGVPVTVEGERREVSMDVGLRDVANEQYALRVQEELQLGGEALPTEQMIDALLAHATDPTGPILAAASLHGEPLDRDDALGLALDLVHKTAWRYAVSSSGISARRATLVRILHVALACELTMWRDLANELSRLNDAQLVAALGGEAAGHPLAGTKPLALFALFGSQAARATPSDDDEWLSPAAPEGEGSMLAKLMASVQLPEAEGLRVARLIRRAQEIAGTIRVPATIAAPPPSADEEWVNVDAMQM